MAQFLLKNVSANVTGDPVLSDGSNKTLVVWAVSLDGGTINVEGSPDGLNWITLTDALGNSLAALSSCFCLLNTLGQGILIRASLSGAGGSASGVNAALF